MYIVMAGRAPGEEPGMRERQDSLPSQVAGRAPGEELRMVEH